MLRKTTTNDIPFIMALYKEAIEDLAQAAIDQWQNNYPNRSSLINDIKLGVSYVFEWDNQVVATCALLWNGDVDYETIVDGEWPNDHAYLTIHRIVVARSHKRRGISHHLMQAIEILALSNGVHQIRVDTHKDNSIMQGYLSREGFKACGIVYIRQQDERIAFYKLLDSYTEDCV